MSAIERAYMQQDLDALNEAIRPVLAMQEMALRERNAAIYQDMTYVVVRWMDLVKWQERRAARQMAESVASR
jgi:hypothetical protein